MRIGRRSVGSAIVLASLALAAAGCGSGAPAGGVATPAQASFTPESTVSNAVAQTRGAIATALGAAGYQLLDPNRPFRPPESALLAAAPRSVFQVALTDDPTHGYIVVYEFIDTALATTAGAEMSSYIASGPGRAQFAPDTRYVLQQFGTTLVFYTWAPSASPGDDGQKIGQALATVGQAFVIPQ